MPGRADRKRRPFALSPSSSSRGPGVTERKALLKKLSDFRHSSSEFESVRATTCTSRPWRPIVLLRNTASLDSVNQ
jgi:hypothetical protein